MADVKTLLEELSLQVQVPTAASKVYKDECMFSFDTPYSEGGLFVSLKSFQGFSAEFVKMDHKKTGNRLYLHLKKVAKPMEQKEQKEISEPPEKKPKQLAIGVEGGFDVTEPRIEYEDVNSLVILPEMTFIPLPNTDIPIMINFSITQILQAQSAYKKDDITAWVPEPRKVSKHAANLLQLDNGVKLPRKGWKCSNCDLTENLWMNLTDGTILCGRKNWDGTGGNGHALEHFQKTGYPLCVKLGTISGEGVTDIYSYDEDDMVEDPKIKEHLAHFGINMEAMQKTEKTITEMEIDQNYSFEFDRIQEAGNNLPPLHGPGYTGMYNIGSSCYLASVMQTVFSLKPFIDRYSISPEELFTSAPEDPSSDLNVQLSKIANGLLSGKYSNPDLPKIDRDGIPPKQFKTVIGKGHPEFSTMRQQDALEFFQYLLESIDRKERATHHEQSPSNIFKFKIEDRIECAITGKVKYTSRIDNILSIPIPLHKSKNQKEVELYQQAKAQEPDSKIEVVRPIISFMDCLQEFAAVETIDHFYSSATKMKGIGLKRSQLATFPPYLMIQTRRFTLGDDMAPKKLDVLLDVPDVLDINFLRASGLQPGESLLPEEDEKENNEQPKININESFVQELVNMGFPYEGCRKGVYYTQNAGIEPATNWILEHLDDADLNEPLVVAGSSQNQSQADKPNEEAIEMLLNMGFNRNQALKALKETGNNLERAADWLFSRAGELEAMELDVEADKPKQGENKESDLQLQDGDGKYELIGLISHIGSNTSCGHYVAHLKKNNQWVLYNDSKVIPSLQPPKDLAYLYLYKRI